MSSDLLVQAALDSVRAAEASLLAWQEANPPEPTPPPIDLPYETPLSVTDVMGALGLVVHVESPPYSDHLDATIAAVKALRVGRLRCRIFNNNTAQKNAMTRIHNETGASFVSNLGQPGQAATAAKMVTWLEGFPQGVVAAVEGNNEPNLQLGADWVGLTKKWMADLNAALRASTVSWVKSIPLLAPALGKRQGYADLGHIPEATLGNIHIYQGGGLADFRLDQGLDDEADVTGDLPVWTTETGYHNAMNNTSGTHLPTSEKAAGVYIPEVPLEHLLRARSGGAYLYELVDNPANPDGTDQEAHFGLLHNDWSPKPAYTGLVYLSDAMADGDALHAPDLSPVQVKVEGPADLQHILFAHSDGSYRMALWRRVSVWDRDKQQDIAVPTAPVQATFAKTFTGNTTTPPGTPVKGNLGAGAVVVRFALS